ncbi:ATP-dependent DNA ligase [uncultured Pseudokineococcus sp.]|uniref:ATP-dependent DNA ligase n=1 Tax=uncultured Pseudokineococcus sp. TaxID=1642928 RepID=UPI0026118779|nr:ATP-dependent DNA ligase [uncultured Pseudokineococcus sp.]
MLLAVLAARLDEVAATSSRTRKRDLVAAVLREAAEDERDVVVRYLEGELRQRRTGLGWRSLADRPPPAAEASLDVLDLDAAMEAAAAEAGPGSAGRRRELLAAVLAAATGPEQRLVGGLVSGELRQGAQRGVLVEAVAAAAGVPAAAVRRALTLSGDVVEVAGVALGASGPAEAQEALAAVGLRVGRPLAPMLAASAPSVADALARTGPAVVEWKLDGVRVQVHREGDEVRLWTRTGEEVTDRLAGVADAVRALPARVLVLDGEVLGLLPGGAADWRDRRPLPFQETASRVATRRRPAAGAAGSAGAAGPGPARGAEGDRAEEPDLRLVLFDLLHRDGEDLLDEPLRRRRAELLRLAPSLAVPGVEASPAEPRAAEEASRDALARGHEGVVVKAADAPYAAGRRGAAWVKVKPRLTLDLVVLAAEHGSGRRRGTLSNLWLGARDPEGRFGPPGGFVMLGKTFKGLTDAMLAWQTEQLRSLAVEEDGWVVRVRPELVVEIALDGVQRSPRYPAGLALRFARVLAHRPDKPAAEADVVEAVERLHAAAGGATGVATHGADEEPEEDRGWRDPGREGPGERSAP